MSDKLPTGKEIALAREQVADPNRDYEQVNEVMKDWGGVGWHKGDIYYGVLIGLRIAENRNEDKPMGRIEQNRIAKQVKSIVCVCGKAKQKTKPFCRKCFASLPDDLKAALSNQLVEEFVTAYATARERLRTR